MLERINMKTFATEKYSTAVAEAKYSTAVAQVAISTAVAEAKYSKAVAQVANSYIKKAHEKARLFYKNKDNNFVEFKDAKVDVLYRLNENYELEEA